MDTRIMTGEAGGRRPTTMGTENQRSVHMDLCAARSTIERIQGFLESAGEAVEWIIAHDVEWAAKNKHRFLFPTTSKVVGI